MKEPGFLGLAIALLVLGVLFALLEGLFRGVPAPPWFRRKDLRTDLAYWFVTPLASGLLTRVAVAGAILAAVGLAGGSVGAVREAFAAGHLPELGWRPGAEALSRLPLAAQLLLGLLLADGIAYWMHRAFHRGWLWRLHAVHHASPTLDWLSSVRLHPLNQALMRVSLSLPILFAGFDPKVFAVAAPFTGFYAILIHANVGWSLGPLRFLVATPRFHRWHHTSEAEGRDTNFAGLFPLWDLVFGTFHMPKDRLPTRFGAGDEPVPAGLVRQLVHPFRRPRPEEPLARDQI